MLQADRVHKNNVYFYVSSRFYLDKFYQNDNSTFAFIDNILCTKVSRYEQSDITPWCFAKLPGNSLLNRPTKNYQREKALFENIFKNNN